MQTLIAANAARWGDVVVGLAINMAGAGAGIGGCTSVATTPVLQDGPAGGMWAALGSYNAFVIVDEAGILRYRIEGVTLPAAEPTIVSAVDTILGL